MAGNANYKMASPEQVAADLGQRLARLRLGQDLSQQELARQAGVSVRTLRRLEAGDNCSLDTLIRLLQALGLHSQLDSFLPDPGRRPAEQMARGWKEPKRASRKSASKQDSSWSWDKGQTP